MMNYLSRVGVFFGSSVCAVAMVSGLGAELAEPAKSALFNSESETAKYESTSEKAIKQISGSSADGNYRSQHGVNTEGNSERGGATSGLDLSPRTGDLPPIDISAMKLFDYSQPWHASDWQHAFSDIPWKFDHVTASGSDVVLILDPTGAPELKGVGQEGHYRGVWEADVSLPEMREGFVAAPLWLYTKYNDGKAGEIDFEFTRLGLQLTLHSEHTGSHQQHGVTVMAGQDWSRQRYKLGIRADIQAGYIEMFVNGKFRKMMMNKEEIENGKEILIFSPKE